VWTIKDPSCGQQRDQVEGFVRGKKEGKGERPLADPQLVLKYRIFSCYPVFRQDRALLSVDGAWSLK